MRAVTRRGLVVLLDLVGSTQELLVSGARFGGRSGEEVLTQIISRIAECFWEQGAETLAFTGDGLLAFIEDTGRASRLSWALSDALRRSEESVHEACVMFGRRLTLRGAVHLGNVLEVIDGPFSGYLVGRTVFLMDELCETARRGDYRPGLIASVAATPAAVRYCGLQVRPYPVYPARQARLLSSLQPLCLLDQPPVGTGGCWPVTRTVRESASGLVLHLELQPGAHGIVFPQLPVYAEALLGLVRLAALCGAEVLNIMPTAVLAFIEDSATVTLQLQQVLRCVLERGPFRGSGLTGPELVKRARASGWQDVRLVAGAAYGALTRPFTGPLTGQALGGTIVFAGRFARQIGADFWWRQTRTRRYWPPATLALPYETNDPRHVPASAPGLWTGLCDRETVAAGRRFGGLPPGSKLSNLPAAGFRSAQILCSEP